MNFCSLKSKCRVCLQASDAMVSIFTKEDNNEPLYQRIIDCGGIMIEPKKRNYPDKICPKCMAYLNISYKFRVTCKNSDNLLNTWLSLNEDQITNAIKSETAICNTEFMENGDIKIEDTNYENDFIDMIDENDIIELDNKESYSDIEDSKTIKDNEKTSMNKFQNKREEKRGDSDYEITLSGHRKKKTESQNNQNRSLKNKKTNKDLLTVVKQPVVVQNEFICEVCGNKYKKKVLLKSHLLWHKDEKDHKCEVCGREFTLNFQLKRHMRVHTGDKPYSCNTCDRKFADYSTCLRHKRTHTNERPFKCDICDRAFTYSCVLKAHMTIHTGEKPYECDQCGKRFSRQHHLKAHTGTIFYQNGCKIVKNSGKI